MMREDSRTSSTSRASAWALRSSRLERPLAMLGADFLAQQLGVSEHVVQRRPQLV